MTITIPHNAHEATSVKEFGGIGEWPIKNNRTPDKLEYQEIGLKNGDRPQKHTHYTYATTALLLAGAAEPTIGSKNLSLEQQYLRREERALDIGTPTVIMDGENVVTRSEIEKVDEAKIKQARETLKRLDQEFIPRTATGRKGEKETDRARYVTGETTTTAGKVVVWTPKTLVNYEKEKNKRINQRDHIETINRGEREASEIKDQDNKNRRRWDDPYKCTLSAESFAMLVADVTGEERPLKVLPNRA